MSRLFLLRAQVLGTERTVSAEADGFGITVHTSRGSVRARSVNDAIRIARDDMGDFLKTTKHAEGAWGLHVAVADVQAVYGNWPLLPGPPSGAPSDSLVTRIRSRWHDSGPISALENAIEVIRGYLTERTRAA